MATRWRGWPLLLCLPAVAGCLQVDLHATLMPDASGKLELELAVHKSRLPFFLKDPLATVDDPQVLRRNTTTGIVAWGPPQRRMVDGWERVTLTAYFDDINRLRFYKTRGLDGPTRILAFRYDPPREPRVVRILADLEPELREPIPMDKLARDGAVELDPDLVRKFLPALRPLLGDVRTSLRLTAPGPLTRASGFGAIEGRHAAYLGDRDDFLTSLQASAGALVDADSLLAANPQIRWTDDASDGVNLAAFRREMRAAKRWWTEQFLPRDAAANH